MPGSPVVASAIAYPAGTRHEPEGKGGLAHLLEHLMFKGAGRWGPGDIDREVGLSGGDANAFTAREVVVYTIDLPPGEWRLALEIEAARMTGLVLASDEVEREKRVVMEEIASAEADPWYGLDEKVMERIYRGHPYGRPILGTTESVLRIGREDLRRFHRSAYGPGGAVLVAAGPLGSGDLDEMVAAFERLPARPSGESAHDSPVESTTALPGPERVESPIGGTRRLLVAWPVPGGGHPDLPALRLASVILTGGRSGRLHRALVEERELCSWVTTDVSDSPGPGTFTVACELHPEESPSTIGNRRSDRRGDGEGQEDPPLRVALRSRDRPRRGRGGGRGPRSLRSGRGVAVSLRGPGVRR